MPRVPRVPKVGETLNFRHFLYYKDFIFSKILLSLTRSTLHSKYYKYLFLTSINSTRSIKLSYRDYIMSGYLLIFVVYSILKWNIFSNPINFWSTPAMPESSENSTMRLIGVQELLVLKGFAELEKLLSFSTIFANNMEIPAIVSM